MPKDNSFTKKYKKELAELDDFSRDVLESANQVKSWKRSPNNIEDIIDDIKVIRKYCFFLIFLAFIMGFSLCAVVMTPLVINSI